MGSSLNETDFSNDTHLSMGGAKRVVEAIKKKTPEKNNNNMRHQQGCHRKKIAIHIFRPKTWISSMLPNITKNFRKIAENDLFFIFSK